MLLYLIFQVPNEETKLVVNVVQDLKEKKNAMVQSMFGSKVI